VRSLSAAAFTLMVIFGHPPGRAVARAAQPDGVLVPPPDAGVGPDAGTGAEAGSGDVAPPDAVSPTETAPVEPPPAPARSVHVAGGGRIEGTVVDAKTGEALIEAQVTVLGTKKKVLTDIDGNFSVGLPPGVYEIRVWAQLRTARRISKIEVEHGKATRIDVALGSDDEKIAVQEVVVVARPDTATEAVQIVKRQKSAAVSDAVSAEQIARSPDSNASDAVKRVVAATVQDGRYVTVRGLGGRYSAALLNGVILPSPEPDVPSVPLDIFPASLLANLTVVKTFTPDMPGNFAGGSLQIETRDYPGRFTLKLKLSGSGDTVTTFRDALTYRGGDLDFLGFDDGTRALPGSVPRDRALARRPGPRGEPPFTDAEIEPIAESFGRTWLTRRHRPGPNLGLSATVGDTLSPGGKRFGYLGTFSYGYKWSHRLQSVRATQKGTTGDVEVVETVDAASTVESASIGGLLNVGFAPSPNHRVNLLSLYTHNADDRALKATGFRFSENSNLQGTRLQFVERSLSFAQLVGEDALLGGKLLLGWQGNLSRTGRYEPDTRDNTYLAPVESPTRFQFEEEPGSGERFFAELEEWSGGGGVDATVSVIEGGKLKWGGAVQISSRTFDARRFRFAFVEVGGDVDALLLPADHLFTPEHIGPDVDFQEVTQEADAYDATRNIYAGYLMADVSRFDPVRVVAGARYELADQELTSGTRFAAVQMPVPGTSRSDSKLLPAASVILGLPGSSNLRAGYSVTVARAQFRELAPFLFFDYVRRRTISGNPDLRQTSIQNFDLRWERFIGGTELVAASAFYKAFDEPIESIITNDTGDVSFRNADGATALGLEVEGRLALGRLSNALRSLSLAANASVIRSRVRLRPGSIDMPQSMINLNRALQGQSPFTVNVELGYRRGRSGTEVSALYNVAGRRISDVGFATLPDIYEQPVHRVDLTLGQRLPGDLSLKLSVSNLLDQSVVFRQADLEVLRFKPGVSFGAALEWSPRS